jgi:hypothetical protein
MLAMMPLALMFLTFLLRSANPALGPGPGVASGGDGSVYSSMDRLHYTHRGVASWENTKIQAQLVGQGFGDGPQFLVGHQSFDFRMQFRLVDGLDDRFSLNLNPV